MLESIQSDPEQLKLVMRTFTSHSRNYPTLARDIIAIDGLGSESQEYWQAWRDAVLDLACDASDQSHLLIIIKRAVGGLSGTKEGFRAVCILADLARIVPSSLELIMKHFEASFPYWKNPQSTLQLQNFTRNALNLGAELPQILERIVDFMTRKILLIDLSIRPEDLNLITGDNLKILGEAADSKSSEVSITGNLTGLGEKYSKEEKAKELEESQLALQQHIDQVQNYANKIDLMLVAFFEFLESERARGKAREVGLFILISFEKIVLPAVKPKFTQFIMFYAASIDNFVTDRLLGSLIANLFSRDAQLASTSQKNSINSQVKAKAIQSTAAFLGSFVNKSKTFTNDSQLKTVVELLSDWIGRKVEALNHFSSTPLEISILAAVLETLLKIISNHPHVSTNDPRLKQAVELCANLLSPELKSENLFSKFFENVSTIEEVSLFKKSNFVPFQSLSLPQSHLLMLNAGIFSE